MPRKLKTIKTKRRVPPAEKRGTIFKSKQYKDKHVSKKDKPLQAKNYYLSSEKHYKGDDFEQAYNHLMQAVELFGYSSIINNPEKAKTITVSPKKRKVTQCILLLANIYDKQGSEQEAFNLLNEAACVLPIAKVALVEFVFNKIKANEFTGFFDTYDANGVMALMTELIEQSTDTIFRYDKALLKRLYENHGEFATRKGAFSNALGDFEKAKELSEGIDPKLQCKIADTLLTRSREKIKNNNMQEAYNDAREACIIIDCKFITEKCPTIDKKDKEKISDDALIGYFLRFANICDECGKHQQAIQVMELIKPYSISAKITLATLYFNQIRMDQFTTGTHDKGLFKEVEILITECIAELKHSDKEKDITKRKICHKNLGELAVFSGDYALAIKSFDNALAIDKGYLSAHHCKARALMKQGDRRQAKNVLQSAQRNTGGTKFKKIWNNNLNILSIRDNMTEDETLLRKKSDGPQNYEKLNGYPGPATCARLCAKSLLNISPPKKYKEWRQLPNIMDDDEFKKSISLDILEKINKNYWAHVYQHENTVIIVHHLKKSITDNSSSAKQNGKALSKLWKQCVIPVLQHLNKQYKSYNIVHTGYLEGASIAEASAWSFGQRALTFESAGNKSFIDELKQTPDIIAKIERDTHVDREQYNLSTYITKRKLVSEESTCRLGGCYGEKLTVKTLSNTHSYDKSHNCYAMSCLENLALSFRDNQYQLPFEYTDEANHVDPWNYTKNCRVYGAKQKDGYTRTIGHTGDYHLFKETDRRAKSTSALQEYISTEKKQLYMAGSVSALLPKDQQSSIALAIEDANLT